MDPFIDRQGLTSLLLFLWYSSVVPHVAFCIYKTIGSVAEDISGGVEAFSKR